jgi:hypothetical protein
MVYVVTPRCHQLVDLSTANVLCASGPASEGSAVPSSVGYERVTVCGVTAAAKGGTIAATATTIIASTTGISGTTAIAAVPAVCTSTTRAAVARVATSGSRAVIAWIAVLSAGCRTLVTSAATIAGNATSTTATATTAATLCATTAAAAATATTAPNVANAGVYIDGPAGVECGSAVLACGSIVSVIATATSVTARALDTARDNEVDINSSRKVSNVKGWDACCGRTDRRSRSDIANNIIAAYSYGIKLVMQGF